MFRPLPIVSLLFLPLILGVFPPQVRAARYAILIGISHYESNGVSGVDLDLHGPEQDVLALHNALLSKQGFTEKDITVLQDKAATRKAILNLLDKTIIGMKSGDYLLLYFSGHGTSAFDRKMRPLQSFIGPNSGALAPYDLKINSTEDAASTLIIGRRDLRPLLEKLPADSETLVILDACYSENSVKSVQPRLKGKVRGINLGGLPNKGLLPAASDGPMSQSSLTSLSVDADPTYPYANVVALTAASKEEAAVDLDERSTVQGHIPTLDGKPHGVFTNSLLEAISGTADLNHDGQITFQELYEYTRRSVQAKYAQTPQMLAPAGKTIVGSPAFSLRREVPPVRQPEQECKNSQNDDASRTTANSTQLLVRFEGTNEDLRRRILAIDGFKPTETGGDLVIHFAKNTTEVYDSTGTLVRRFDSKESEHVIKRIAAEPALRKFIAFSYPCQSFTASLNLSPAGQSRFSDKDKILVQSSLDRPAYLMLFDVDQSGSISIVYPVSPAERAKNPAGTVHMGTLHAEAPFGSEYLKLVAFSEEPPLASLGCKLQANGNLNCPVIDPDSQAFENLLKFSSKAATGSAESRMRFVTYQE